MILTGLSNPKACIQIIHGFFILCDTFFTSMKSDNSTFKQGKKQYIYIYCNTLLYILLLFIIYIIIYIYICIYICINIYTVYIYIYVILYVYSLNCVLIFVSGIFPIKPVPQRTRSFTWFQYGLCMPLTQSIDHQTHQTSLW